MSVPFDYKYRELAPNITLWELKGDPNPIAWAGMMKEAAQILLQLERRGRRMGFIIDPSELSYVDAASRREAGNWRAENMPLIANVVPCASYVATNAWLRGAITAIFWIAPPVVPVGIKGSREDALAWMKAELAASGVVPNSL